MTPSAATPTVLRCGPEASAPRVVMTDLERFWPSRRGHAFDEFCRPSAR